MLYKSEKNSRNVINAQKESDFYLYCEWLRNNWSRYLTQPFWKLTLTLPNYFQVPYHAHHVVPLYFKGPWKVQLFAICSGANKNQVNYESQSIVTNGTHAHCVNSMVHHYFGILAMNQHIICMLTIVLFKVRIVWL